MYVKEYKNQWFIIEDNCNVKKFSLSLWKEMFKNFECLFTFSNICKHSILRWLIDKNKNIIIPF